MTSRIGAFCFKMAAVFVDVTVSAERVNPDPTRNLNASTQKCKKWWGCFKKKHSHSKNVGKICFLFFVSTRAKGSYDASTAWKIKKISP